jgi:hypothetical protein
MTSVSLIANRSGLAAGEPHEPSPLVVLVACDVQEVPAAEHMLTNVDAGAAVLGKGAEGGFGPPDARVRRAQTGCLLQRPCAAQPTDHPGAPAQIPNQCRGAIEGAALVATDSHDGDSSCGYVWPGGSHEQSCRP